MNTPTTIILVCLALSGCSLAYFEPPTYVHEDMHDAGTVLAFNQDESLLASGGRGGWVHLYRLPQAKLVQSWRAHGDDTVNGVVFERDTLFTAGYDKRLVQWALNGRVMRETVTPAPVTHMTYDTQRSHLITGHSDGVVRVWSTGNLRLLTEYAVHSAALIQVAVQTTTGLLASSGADGRIFLITEGRPRELARPPTDAATLTFAPAEERLYGGGWFKLFHWDLQTGELTVLNTPHHGLIKKLHWTPDTHQLASISRQTDSSIYFLDPDTGAATRRFEKHDLCGAAVAVSPHARFLASTSDDASVKIWDLRRKPIQ